jgi:hypothetical protein
MVCRTLKNGKEVIKQQHDRCNIPVHLLYRQQWITDEFLAMSSLT